MGATGALQQYWVYSGDRDREQEREAMATFYKTESFVLTYGARNVCIESESETPQHTKYRVGVTLEFGTVSFARMFYCASRYNISLLWCSCPLPRAVFATASRT